MIMIIVIFMIIIYNYNQQQLIIVAALFYSKYSIQAANDSASIEYIWDPSYFIVSVL